MTRAIRDIITTSAANDIRAQVIELMGNMTIRELESRSGVGRSTICRILRGNAPTVDTVVALFEALGQSEVTIRW